MTAAAAGGGGWEILTVKGVYQSKLAAPATVRYTQSTHHGDIVDTFLTNLT